MAGDATGTHPQPARGGVGRGRAGRGGSRRRRSLRGTEPIERISTFHSLRYPEYRLLFISGLFIFLGVQAQMIVRGLARC